jgi:hypothetical protein
MRMRRVNSSLHRIVICERFRTKHYGEAHLREMRGAISSANFSRNAYLLHWTSCEALPARSLRLSFTARSSQRCDYGRINGQFIRLRFLLEMRASCDKSSPETLLIEL